MRINNNIHALNAYRNLNINQFKLGRNMERLSSGLRINRAADDAAGLAISEKMRSQIRGLAMAERNSLDGISLIQTAEGALNEVHSMLQRMKELAVQAANETYEVADRREIQKEINQLLDEIDRISEFTEFNTKKLLDGTFGEINLHQVVGNEINFSGGGISISSGSTIRFQLADGTYHEITFTKSYNISSASGMPALVKDMQTLIDSIPALAKAGVKVELDRWFGTSIVFSANEEVLISPSTVIESLGFSGASSTSTIFESVSLSNYQTKGSIPINLEANPIEVSGGNNTIEFALNGKEITIQLSGGAVKTYDGSDGNKLEDLLKAIQDAINADNDLKEAGLKVDKDEQGRIVFTSNEYIIIKGGTLLDDLKLKEGALAEMPSVEGIALQIGANEGQRLTFVINEVSTRTLGYGVNTIAYDPSDPKQANYGNLASLRVDPSILETATSGGVLTHEDAGKAMTIIDKAIQQLSTERSKLGAIQNRLEHAISNLSTTRENLTASESRIRDADMALEMTEFTKNNIINQAATAMLAQANQLPQGVLQLLQ